MATLTTTLIAEPAARHWEALGLDRAPTAGRCQKVSRVPLAMETFPIALDDDLDRVRPSHAAARDKSNALTKHNTQEIPNKRR
jgi:hypothetical protein